MRFIKRLLRNLILPNNAGENDPATIIGPDIPQELIDYYAADGGTVIAVFIFRRQAGVYNWLAQVIYEPQGVFVAMGVTDFNTGDVQFVSETFRVVSQQGSGGYSTMQIGTLDPSVGAVPAELYIMDGSSLRALSGGQIVVASGAEASISGDVFLLSGSTLDAASGSVVNVSGTLDIESGANLNVQSGGDIEVLSGGDINLQSGSNLNVQSGGDIEVLSGGDINAASGSVINVSGTLDIESGANLNVQSGGDIEVLSGGDINVASGGSIVTSSGSDLTVNGTVTGTSFFSTQDEVGTNVSGFSGTTFAQGASVCGLAFTAPPSGKVLILWNANVESNGTTDIALVGFAIRAGSTIGSGAVERAADSDHSITSSTGAGLASRDGGGKSYLHSGLTAGNSYNVVTEHAMSGGTDTGDIFFRSIIVIAMP